MTITLQEVYDQLGYIPWWQDNGPVVEDPIGGLVKLERFRGIPLATPVIGKIVAEMSIADMRAAGVVMGCVSYEALQTRVFKVVVE